MKRYTILSLFFLTFVLPIFAAVGETFTNSDAKYANLVFTVLDEDAKTVSVKAEDISYYRADSILNIPASVTNSGDTYTVTTIAADGFKAIQIKQIILPATIKKIESAALRSIDTPFSINLNEGLQEIGGRAFTGSKLQDELLIPSTITKIGSAAFFNTPVKTVIMQTYSAPTLAATSSDITNKYYIFPATATIVVPEKSYFVYCSANHWKTWKITDPYIHIDNNIKYSIISDTSASVLGFNTTPSEVVDLVIPETISFNDCSGALRTLSITQTNDNCFNGINLLSSIVFPSSMRIIGYQSFRDNSTIRSIKLNEGLQEIGNRAFCNDVNIEDTITISQTVTTIGSAAFNNCGKIRAFRIQNETPPDVKTTDIRPFEKCNAVFLVPCGYSISYLSDTYWGTLNISDPCSEFEVNGLYYSLAGEKKVKLIGYEKTKALPNTFNIPTEVAYQTKTYTIVNIGANTFENDTNIVFVALPSHCITIGKSAFKNCKKLQKLVLNEGLETIEDSSFCSTIIDTLRTPTTLKYIGGYAFRDNASMKRIILNEGLQVIGNRSFTNNKNICDSVLIPSTTQQIGTAAFYNCGNITNFILQSQDAPKANNDSKYPIFNSTAIFTIPCGSMSNYSTADYWKDLRERFVTACKPLVLSPETTLEQDTIVSSIAYSRTFDMDVWQTLYLPFEVDSVLVEEIWEGKPYYYDINKPYDSQKGGYFYLNNYKEASAEDETITFTPATTLEGNTPYLIQFPQISSDGYFAGKNIIFKSKTGEHILKKSDYTQPKASNLFQISGNSSVYNQDVSKMYIFAATAVKDDQGNPIKTSDSRDSIKYEFNQQTSTTLKPFDFGLLPYEVKPSSGASLLPTRMSLRISRGSGNTGGGNITTSIADSEAAYAITYRVNANNLLLHQNGHPCQLYSISGTLLYTSAEGTEEVTIPLEKGIYILYCEGQSQKIVL